MIARAHPTLVRAACGALATLVLGMLAACSGDLTSVTCTSNADCPSNRCEAGRCIEGAAPDDATDATEDTAEVTEDPSPDTAGDAPDVVEDAARDDVADAFDVTEDAVVDATDAVVDVAPDTLADAPDDADAAASDTSDAPEDIAPDVVADTSDADGAPDAPSGALGAACSSGSACASGFCGNGHCAPEGFAYIAPGTFTMGSPAGEAGRFRDEREHSVTLTRAFFLQQTEVTQRQWRMLIGNNPSAFASCGDSCPVETVNWYEALAYANVLSDAEGLARCYTLSGCRNALGNDMECSSVSVTAEGGNPLLCEGYRLPTESEWEFAARAGSSTATYLGDLQHPTLCDPQPNLEPIGWYCANASVSYDDAFDCSSYGGPASCGPRPVGTRSASPWGLHDMLGNVFEWCWDWYDTYPGTVTDPLGPTTGTARVRRGGSSNGVASYARAAFRNLEPPAGRLGSLGFRMARTAP